MKRRKHLLIGAAGLVLLIALGGWLYERRFSPDERLHRTLIRDFNFCLRLSQLSANAPGHWLPSRLRDGSQYFQNHLSETENQLKASGYFTNYRFVITNFPAPATNAQLKSDEVSRRLRLNVQINPDDFFSYTGPDDDGQISVTCRPSFLPNFVNATHQP